MNNAMREAFVNAQVKKGTGAAIINTCAKVLMTKAGVVPDRVANGTTLNLTNTTMRRLIAEKML